MIRVKTFDATGLAPNGVLFAGDINAIEDAAAALTDFTQAISLSSILVGDNTIQLFKYGASESRLTSALRTDGIVRALGGLYAGAFTTTQRDAIPGGQNPQQRPYGLVILNTITNQYEWNAGTDAAPIWRPLGVDPTGSTTFTGATSAIAFSNQNASNLIVTSRRSGDSVDRIALREDGRIEIGPGGSAARDTFLARSGVATLDITNNLRVLGNLTLLNAGSQLIFNDGTALATSPWSYSYASMRLGLLWAEGVLSPPTSASPNPQNALIISAGTGWNLVIGIGAALVQGDDDAWQGLYAHLQRTAFTLALTTQAPTTNPRIDAIGIQFNDPTFTARTPATSAHTGNVIQIAGTPTAGATLANLNGAPGKTGGPAFPPSFLLLGYYLANVGDAGVVAGQISDQRKLAGPAIWGEDNHRYRLGIDASGTFGLEQVV